MIPINGTPIYNKNFMLSVFDEALNNNITGFISENYSCPLKKDVIFQLWTLHLYYALISKRIKRIEWLAFSRIESYFVKLTFFMGEIIEFFDLGCLQYDLNIKFKINRELDGLNNKKKVFIILLTNPEMINNSNRKPYTIANKIKTFKWKYYYPKDKVPSLNTIVKYVKDFL